MATAERHVSAMQKQRELTGVQSVAQLFRSRLAIDGGRTAARRKVVGKWEDVSWNDLNASAEEVGWGLVSLGVKKGEMVSILAGTRVEWTECDLGIAFS
ncbi:MAG: AMP-binding protein, partial [Myxococcales bacterium]|nr:AMP-binding protein [Myxococcales bacterium]